MIKTSRLAYALLLIVWGAALVAQTSLLKYPSPHKGDVFDTYFGTKVADPYRWMEDLNAAELKKWVDAENAVTFKYLDALPVRDTLKKRLTELYDYPRVTIPRYEGRRWFYSRNSGLQRQSVVFTRETLNGRETVAIDPNALSPDGSVQLSQFNPSPDGQYVGFGQAEGGSDLETYYVRELASGRQLPDTIRWMKFSGVDWTKDGKGFFYGRYPEPPPGKGLQVADHDPKIYYHRIGTEQAADRLIYERPDEPALYLGEQLDEAGRYLFILAVRGTSPKNELFVKDLRNPLAPAIDAPVVPIYPGHTAAYEPLGVAGGRLYLRTDRDASNGRIVAVPLDAPDQANWKTIVPESRNAIESAALIAGRVVVNRNVDVASEVTLFSLDGTQPVKITPPGLGTITGPVGRFDRPEVFYTFTRRSRRRRCTSSTSRQARARHSSRRS